MARSTRGNGKPTNRGGVRQGQPGRTYTNRSDLQNGPRLPAQPSQPVRAASGQGYGVRGAQEAAQRIMPLPAPTPLNAPTQRPMEPLTAGMQAGPGPGPDALMLPPGGPPQEVPPIELLRAMAARYPDVPELRLLFSLAEADERGI